ncbi:MAG: hypothetical protein Q9202_006649 [Teloschistes flavicans]
MNAGGKSKQGVEASLKSLIVPEKKAPRQEVSRVADSWEDEAPSSSASSDSEIVKTTNESSVPGAPPPTPISPSARNGRVWGDFSPTYSPPVSQAHGSSRAQSPPSRPEKSTATAGRMINSALGMKAAKKSEEEQAYERAIREKEAKRIAREREVRRAEEEKRSQVRRQIWED